MSQRAPFAGKSVGFGVPHARWNEHIQFQGCLPRSAKANVLRSYGRRLKSITMNHAIAQRIYWKRNIYQMLPLRKWSLNFPLPLDALAIIYITRSLLEFRNKTFFVINLLSTSSFKYLECIKPFCQQMYLENEHECWQFWIFVSQPAASVQTKPSRKFHGWSPRSCQSS